MLETKTKHIVTVYKMYLETLWCKDNSSMRKTRYQRKVKHNISNTVSLKQHMYRCINYIDLVSVIQNSSL